MNQIDQNVADRLQWAATQWPDLPAVIDAFRPPADLSKSPRVTFQDLNEEVDAVAKGLINLGIEPGHRIVLLVPPGVDFVTMVFALFRAGAVVVMIDPGMGIRQMIRCLASINPAGFAAIPKAHWLRSLFRRHFPSARFNLTVSSRRLPFTPPTWRQIRGTDASGMATISRNAQDPAAIIFTSGSTGPAKGVLYRHGNFNSQVETLRDTYALSAGQIDVAAFPMFALFNAAVGVTTVIPPVHPSRPGKVNVREFVRVLLHCNPTQAFASPAVWRPTAEFCIRSGITIPSLKHVLTAGAPIPTNLMEKLHQCLGPEAEIHTPYGATEALPVSTISSRTIVTETASQTRSGKGICVGTRLGDLHWRIIPIHDGPIDSMDCCPPLPCGEIGELIVRGSVVTSEYVTSEAANRLAKIADSPGPWHRMGDVGYLDERDRFWYCGRLSQRVRTLGGPLFTECCEAIINAHPSVARSALVGVGEGDTQEPIMICEWNDNLRKLSRSQASALREEILALAQGSGCTRQISRVLFCRPFPVDPRHNAKIVRELLATWARSQL